MTRLFALPLIFIFLMAMASGVGRILPDEGQIVYQRGQPGVPAAIYRLDVRAALSVRMTRALGRAEGSPVWSPDGERIAYAYDARGDNFGSLTGTVVVMDARGRERQAVNVAGGDVPMWSPAGDALIFVVADRFFVRADLEGQFEPVRDLPAWHPLAQRGRLLMSNVSPRSTQITQTPSAAPTQTSGTFVPAPEAREVEEDEGAILDVAWSRAGDLVVVAYLEEGMGQLYRLDSACIPNCAGQLVPIPNTLGAQYPTLSPDGTQIVYICQQGQRRANEVCIINVDGTGLRVLTGSSRSTANLYPDWRP
jgi:hypothetical protein